MASQNAELNSELPVAIMPKGSTPSGARISRTTSASRPRVESGCSVMAMTPAPRFRAMPARNDTSVVSPPLDRPTQTSSGRTAPAAPCWLSPGMEEQRRRPAAGQQMREPECDGVRRARPGDDHVPSAVEQHPDRPREIVRQRPGQLTYGLALPEDDRGSQLPDFTVVHRVPPAVAPP